MEPLRPSPLWLSTLETGLLAGLPLLLGAALFPADPFLLSARFSWLAFPALLAGLRYGSSHGLLAAGLIASALLAWATLGGSDITREIPLEPVIGATAVGLVAGEFSDWWRRRLRLLEALAEQRRLRLDRFSRDYHLLCASHHRLEQEAALRPTLREAVTAVSAAIARSSGSPGELARAALDVLAEQLGVQIASFHLLSAGRPLAPAARLGQSPDCLSDALLLSAVSTGKVASVGPDSPPGVLVAAVPLVDVSGKAWGAIAIAQMPFLSLRPDSLRLLALLGGQLGDALAEAGGLAPPLAERHARFARRLRRCLADARAHQIPSALVELTLDRGPTDALIEAILTRRRALDASLLTREAQGWRLRLLLPMADAAGLQGFLGRLEGIFKAIAGARSHEVGIRLRSWVLDGSEKLADLLPAPLKEGGDGRRTAPRPRV